jgi:hypothetical protein
MTRTAKCPVEDNVSLLGTQIFQNFIKQDWYVEFA